MILHNGKITTLDPNNPQATSVAIMNGRIVGVEDADSYERGPNTKVIDLKGRRVIPGLNDSHLHVIRGILTKVNTADLMSCRQFQHSVLGEKNYV